MSAGDDGSFWTVASSPWRIQLTTKISSHLSPIERGRRPFPGKQIGLWPSDLTAASVRCSVLGVSLVLSSLAQSLRDCTLVTKNIETLERGIGQSCCLSAFKLSVYSRAGLVLSWHLQLSWPFTQFSCQSVFYPFCQRATPLFTCQVTTRPWMFLRSLDNSLFDSGALLWVSFPKCCLYAQCLLKIQKVAAERQERKQLSESMSVLCHHIAVWTRQVDHLLNNK